MTELQADVTAGQAVDNTVSATSAFKRGVTTVTVAGATQPVD